MTRRRTTLLVFALLLLVAAALQPGYVDNVDSRIVMRTAERLLDHGDWSLGDVQGTYFGSPEYGARGADGSFQMKFGPGMALLQVPFLALGRTLAGVGGLDRAQAGEAAVAASAALWFAVSGVLLLRLARRVLDERAAVAAVVLHAFASYALPYGRSAYLETPLTATILLAYDAALACRDGGSAWSPPLRLGAACAAALWIKVAAGVFLLGLPLVFLPPPGGGLAAAVRTALRALPAFALGVGALLAVQAARFGHPFATGYGPSARFDHPVGAGLAGLVFGERGGLLFHAPLALVGIGGLPFLPARARGFAAAVAVSTGAALVLHATFFSPYGGDAWGPRYLLPCTALLAVPAASVLVAALRGGAAARFGAAAAVAFAAALQIAPSIVSFHEVYTLRAAHPGHGVPNGVLLARIAVAKFGSGDDGYDLGRLGAGAGRWTPPGVQRGYSLWPALAARRAPTIAPVAWTLFGLAVLGALVCARSLRRGLT